MMQTATFAGGCFWCTEAIFKRIKSVESVMPGYAGGTVENPTYQDVCSGETGHAEAIQITFDPTIISFAKLLEVFFKLHDPTTLNRQGNDIGTQYRSAIFYHNDEQKQAALNVKEKLAKEGMYQDRIVTEITPFTNFYPAENYHQSYYDTNRTAPYCAAVIDPKIKKLMEGFKQEVKERYR